ncbi:hypothetical protein HN858_00485 [Candidatus Falkowbacteria bacterium]|jgi:hypothetical protein|nr:hypothetical protein [Candidatus Falkowbacteria bacterium]MBT5503741.1 hypothetical protein [Candidatus Falkowbacteria bacterium]MBT6573780.1 hypothetical protein [Candidatus Falkowbacteria bacterium]MBT7348130.1 hypothetical protein [Candidatus Falkowbacteria bacterium]MBT7500716.1 hypothetical protein [Candidatus Falkowbacteria bacterium]
MKKLLLVYALILVVGVGFLSVDFVQSKSMAESLSGKILLQVEDNGEAWYVYPGELTRYYLGRPADAFDIMRDLGLGVSEADYTQFDGTAPSNLAGKILLRVEANGEAYYVYPNDLKLYYLGRPADAFDIMRSLGLGITNVNLEEVAVAPKSKTVLTALDNLIKSVYSCSVCGMGEKCVAGSCQAVALTNTSYCGNFVCEAGESYDGSAQTGNFTQCAVDCSAPCTDDNCNEYVRVDCGCSESAELSARHGCVSDAPACTSCGTQATLFPELLSIQTEIVKCLEDYFQFRPAKMVYKVFNNPTLDKCTLPEGCDGFEGGSGGPDYVMFHNLDGFREYNQVVPTKPEHLTADVHETTHYFLYQMLHGVPSWFHEAIAIQTNERLDCTDRQMELGDSYLNEKGVNTGGIVMGNDRFLDYGFYRDFRDGKVSLTTAQKDNHYLTASLFLMGLKEEYSCGFECVGDTVIKLKEFEQTQCRTGSGSNCAISNYQDTWGLGWLDGSELKANKVIKQKFEDVIGKDISSLLDLVGLDY